MQKPAANAAPAIAVSHQKLITMIYTSYSSMFYFFPKI